jgi:predicted phosphodiesterase
MRLSVQYAHILLVVCCLAACQVQPTLTPVFSIPAATKIPNQAPTLTSIPSATQPPPPTLQPTATSQPTLTPTPTLTPAQATGVQLVRGPYLQLVTPDSIIVVWETDLPVEGSVVYGETDAYGLRQDDPTAAKKHAVTLSGLKPYTTYFYRIETQNAPLSQGYSLRTAAGPDQAAFNFVVFGDTRTQYDIHQSVVNRIVEMKPDFVLHVGDLVGSGVSPYDWVDFFKIEQKLMAVAPLYPVLGNHESNSPLYFNAFYLPNNKRWYTFDYGNTRIIGLEIDGFQETVDPQNQQFTWLEETLASNTQPWVFVFFHAPINTMLALEPNWLDNILVPLFEKYNVSAVFAGHFHNYQRRVINGIIYVITGGGGAPLYKVEWGSTPPLVYLSAYHAIDISIDRKKLTAVVQQPDGTEIDHFTLTAP